jgi:phosphoribosylglycinamide formyltransferase 1
VKRIVIFASGMGSNAEKIIQYFKDNNSVSIDLIVSNKQDAGVMNIAAHHHIPTLIIDKLKLQTLAAEWNNSAIDLIVLAGFLWQIPISLIKAYPNKIINIHPALLPKYGGKGMYGKAIHKAVLANSEMESGITIHYVNEQYDEGKILLQVACKIAANETIESLSKKIQQLEHQYLPKAIETLLQ